MYSRLCCGIHQQIPGKVCFQNYKYKNPEIGNLASFWSNVQSDVPLSRKPRILYLSDIFQDRSDRNLLQFLLTDKNI